MGVDAYLKTSLSPYTLNSDAMKLIALLNESFSIELERKTIVLINAAEMHPSMSRYQLSLTHKALGDCYYEHGYLGSALEQYNRALAYNKNLAVKRRMSKALALSPGERKISQSPDMVFDVLQYPEYRKVVEDDTAERQRMSDELWAGHDNFKKIVDFAREKAAKEALRDNLTFDPEHEAEIERRLDALGEPYKTEFYRKRQRRRLTHRSDDPVSLKEYDLLDLQSMERSKKFSSGKDNSL